MAKRTWLERLQSHPHRLPKARRALVAALLAAALVGCSHSYSEARPPESPAAVSVGGVSNQAAPASAPAPAEPMDEQPASNRDHDDVKDAQVPARTMLGATPPPPAPPPIQAKSPPSGVTTSGLSGQTSSEVAAVQGPMLIYTAQITMAVFEVNSGLKQVEDLAREVGGFLSKRDDNSVAIRVPVARFPEAVSRVEKMGDMLHRNVSAEDVTEEFRDVEVRIRNARAVRDRLEQLLQKATKVEDSVIIERELARVTQELEQMEGRMKYLKDRAAFSTITVTFEARRQENVASTFHLPVPWLSELGLGRLLSL